VPVASSVEFDDLSVEEATVGIQFIDLEAIHIGWLMVVHLQPEAKGIDDLFAFRIAYFKMQVGPVGAPAVTHASDVLILPKGKKSIGQVEIHFKATAFVLFAFDESLYLICEAIHVPIDGGVAVGVGDVEGLAIARSLHLDTGDIAIGRGIEGIADFAGSRADVHARVEMIAAQFSKRAGQTDAVMHRPDKIRLRVAVALHELRRFRRIFGI